MTSSIHLIENLGNMRMLNKEAAEWESGWWSVAPETAEKLIGGHIYFHKKQVEPSFFGGVILSYRIETEGEWAGRILFKFRTGLEFKNIKAGTSGWSMEKKIKWTFIE
jgi:hypothetical protein